MFFLIYKKYAVIVNQYVDRYVQNNSLSGKIPPALLAGNVTFKYVSKLSNVLLINAN